MLFLLSILPLKDGIRTKKKSLFYYVVFVIVCFRISCLVEHVQQEHRDVRFVNIYKSVWEERDTGVYTAVITLKWSLESLSVNIDHTLCIMTFRRGFLGCLRGKEVHMEITLLLLLSGHTSHSAEAQGPPTKFTLKEFWFLLISLLLILH